ncbi:MAG: DUF2330 domain-containing protein [Armatimonadota bacterium]
MVQALYPTGNHRRQITSLSRTKALAIVLGGSVLISSAWACSGVGPPGKPVVFGDQTNIVIWDEASHTEHFIRNANFRSGADDFGFIAPTPGKPELHEASNKAFYTLAALAPVYPSGFGGGGGAAFDRKSKSSEVQVIQEADVAGFHATTLLSRSAQAINDWMNEHGYVSTPEVQTWAERYCSRGWYLTAFKVVDKTKLVASTGTVRMTFKTSKPFNPFYVPATNILPSKKGTLRLYFVSVGDYEAKIGRKATWQTPQWTAQIPEATSALLAKQVKIPAEAIPDNCQVETFVDNDFPRSVEDDIYFTKKRVIRSSAASPSREIPTYAMAPLLGGLGLLVFSRRRRNTV